MPFFCVLKPLYCKIPCFFIRYVPNTGRYLYLVFFFQVLTPPRRSTRLSITLTRDADCLVTA